MLKYKVVGYGSAPSMSFAQGGLRPFSPAFAAPGFVLPGD
jgi:hypothetical protein